MIKIGGNFLTGTLPKQIELLDLSDDVGFDEQFCQVCSEGFIPESTTTNFTLKGNFSCTYMFPIHNNNLLTINNGDSLYNNEYLTMDQCASFKNECVNCVYSVVVVVDDDDDDDDATPFLPPHLPPAIKPGVNR